MRGGVHCSNVSSDTNVMCVSVSVCVCMCVREREREILAAVSNVKSRAGGPVQAGRWTSSSSSFRDQTHKRRPDRLNSTSETFSPTDSTGGSWPRAGGAAAVA